MTMTMTRCFFLLEAALMIIASMIPSATSLQGLMMLPPLSNIMVSSCPSSLQFDALTVISQAAPAIHATALFQVSLLDHVSSMSTTFGDAASSTIHISEAASAAAVSTTHYEAGTGLLGRYLTSLTVHPLETKMITGAVLALVGDAIAQSFALHNNNNINDKDDDEAASYCWKRSGSFAVFDAAYRASQHVLYPMVVQLCQGQFILGLLPTTTASVSFVLSPTLAAAVEQTLVSQFIIVPLLYYPVFYAVTSYVQGLTWEGTVDRAATTFVPLMKRNLLFWIPVQFIQFSFVPADLQIPLLSVCGLCWTMILSVMAGSAKDYGNKSQETVVVASRSDEVTTIPASASTTTTMEQQQQPPEEPYCVTGMEDNCLIPEDGLFPHASLEDISHELEDIGQELGQDLISIVDAFGATIASTNDNDDDDNDENGSSSMAEKEEEELLLRK